MTVTSFYPVITSQDVATTTTFYRDILGFDTTFESDWYVSLRLGAFELAILAHDHPTIPQGYRDLPCGIILNLEVDDVDELYSRLTGELNLEPVTEMRDEDFGQRHFTVAAPDGVLLDVIQPIRPSAQYAEAYTQD
ncbi:VOC family protein [Actinomyces bowdenii]|uniref:VOC family protein n=1 Tax=Actinomyces bowdenii TaxID=131109 RepID=A0A853ELW7_9ACTO|nr:VOC family protein [Actinomyces bowdenii]MBF0698066.1 VOC family protein [Actinomyces bowdenii]NYS70239.1 VOC family protein [Actinomyces bowdenii]